MTTHCPVKKCLLYILTQICILTASRHPVKRERKVRDSEMIPMIFFIGRVNHTRNAFEILMCMLYALLLLWFVIFYFVLFDTPCICVTWEHVSMCKFILHHCLVCKMSIFVACEFWHMSVKTTKLDECQGIKLPQSSLQFIHAVVPSRPKNTPVFFNGISIFGVPGDVAASSRRSEDSPTPVVVWKGPKVGRCGKVVRLQREDGSKLPFFPQW